MNFKFEEDMEGFKIVYTKYPVKLLQFKETGFGVTHTTLDLANKILGFLNSLPENETIPYPYKTSK